MYYLVLGLLGIQSVGHLVVSTDVKMLEEWYKTKCNLKSVTLGFDLVPYLWAIMVYCAYSTVRLV